MLRHMRRVIVAALLGLALALGAMQGLSTPLVAIPIEQVADPGGTGGGSGG